MKTIEHDGVTYKIRSDGLVLNPNSREMKRARAYWYNDTHAECGQCKQIKPKSEFSPKKRIAKIKGGGRQCEPKCRECNNKYQNDKRRALPLPLHAYRKYKYSMRSEGNDCDLSFEEFLETHWPEDGCCPVLGWKFEHSPEGWTTIKTKTNHKKGGRQYPFIPSTDHIDPTKPLSKDNMWIISMRANEMKSDMIPQEIHLLSSAMKRLKGGLVSSHFFGEQEFHKTQLKDKGYAGKGLDQSFKY